jgi:chemotaxis protein CheD
VARACESMCVLETGEIKPGVVSELRGRSTFYLHPGHIFVSPNPCTITTILGSCVSVCLWDPFVEVGGANHFLLPTGTADPGRSPRFGTVAVGRLIEELLALGCEKRSLRAKVFGGACVMEPFQDRPVHLGLRNVDVGLNLLLDEGIAIVAQDVGGRRGRRVTFDTHDGCSFVRQL